MHSIVRFLRAREYRIRTDEELKRVQGIFRSVAKKETSNDSLMRYARIFRNLLTIDVLPEVFSLTNGIQVPFYQLGDQVDGQFFITEKIEGVVTTKYYWDAGVVIKIGSKNQALPYEVFWIGKPPKKSGHNRNPTWVSAHILRQHAEGASIGSDSTWTCYRKIVNYHASLVQEVPEAESGTANRNPPPLLSSSRMSERLKAKGSMVVQDDEEGEEAEEEVEEEEEEGRRTTTVVLDDDEEAEEVVEVEEEEEEEEEEVDEEEEEEDDDDDDCSAGPPPIVQDDVHGSNGNHSRARPPCNDRIPDFGRSGKPPTAKYEQYYWALLANDTDYCIQTLEALAAGRAVQEEYVIEEGKKILKKRCCALFALYGNIAFEKFYDDAVAALDSYEGKESPFTSEFVLHHLKTFAFILSPRMWLKAELLMLMCILVDKDLSFTAINQKDGKDELRQNRSMACLPVQVQRVIYDRLKLYNCAPAKCVSRDYGGVALCSGGSYKSMSDWFYLPSSLFEADLSVQEGHIFAEISGAPDALSVNGPYVRTTDMFNGSPVYAQLNSVEFARFKSVIHTHATACTKWLTERVPTFLKATRTGERLLVRNEENDAWIVQSVSAYKGFIQRKGVCGFHLLKRKDASSKGDAATSTCFKGVGIEHDTHHPIMQDCNAELSWADFKSTVFIKDSRFQFSFGSKRCAGSVHELGSKHRPDPTRKQAFHTDGPITFASLWTPNSEFDMTGSESVVTDLPACDPDSWSLSALCAFFGLTALGVPGEDGASLKLDIPIGRSLIFRFDFLHQGWKCVGDDGDRSLPVHFRAHFYMFGGSLRELPVADFEAALEFLSCLSHGEMDSGTSFLLLECLQTFVPPEGSRRKDLVAVAKKRGYSLFANVHQLSRHLDKTVEPAKSASRKRGRS
jgi:hypothetical protein